MAKYIIHNWVAILTAVFAIIMICFVGLVTVLKAVWLNRIYTPLAPVARNIGESRQKGLFISDLHLMPERFELSRGYVEVQEAWVEAEAITEYTLVWFPSYRTTGHCYLCLRIRLENPNLLDDKIEFAYNEDKTNYFAQIISGDRQEIFAWAWCASPSDYPKVITIESEKQARESKPITLRLEK